MLKEPPFVTVTTNSGSLMSPEFTARSRGLRP
jgi:hypothetical protein